MRRRISTTVDSELLETARGISSWASDARMVDEALRALIARQRGAELDAAYAAYDARPIDEPDDWGDLASFRAAVGGA